MNAKTTVCAEKARRYGDVPSHGWEGASSWTVWLAVGLACCGLSALSADLTVARGETLDLAASGAYETVTVSGTLNIPEGVSLTAATLELGPDAGDTAVVNVLGSKARGLTVTTLVVGASGGVGQIVALSPDATHNTGWDGVLVVKLGQVTIAASAAADGGFVDFLKLGPGTCDVETMTNLSAARARVLVRRGCLGYSQHWGKVLFKGSFQVESFDGGYIRFGCAYGQRVLNDGSLVVKGHGQDVHFCRYADTADQEWRLCAGLVWEDVRHVYADERHPVTVRADDLLPHGPSAGGFFVNGVAPSGLSIGKTVQRLNAFSSVQELPAESLKGGAGAKVVFGEGDADGFLRGRIADAVGVYKVGAGTFSVTNAAQVGALTVSGGTVRVAAPFTLSDLTVEAGARLDIDGVTVAPSSGRAVIRGEVIETNGGRLLTSWTVASDERLAGAEAGLAGEWTKDGAGTLVLEEPVRLPARIRVRDGVLAFSAVGYACDLYRWNVTDWSDVGWLDAANGFVSGMFYLGELAFVAPDGARLTGIKTAAVGTAPADLAPGEAAFASGTTLMTAGGAGNAGDLFDAKDWPRVGVASPLTTEAGGVTLYVRLPADAGPVAALNFTAAWGGFPKSWTLSGSLDGGRTWQELNAVTDYSVSNTDSARWRDADKDGYGSPVPKAFPFSCADLAYARPSALDLPESLHLEVDAGAVADFSNVTGGPRVGALTVDVAGGCGTVKGAAFAEAGDLFLVNVPAGARLDGLSVPLALASVDGVDGLGVWRVHVNGEPQREGRWRAVWRNGQLRLVGKGCVLYVR